jgi:hypothetical protein
LTGSVSAAIAVDAKQLTAKLVATINFIVCLMAITPIARRASTPAAEEIDSTTLDRKPAQKHLATTVNHCSIFQQCAKAVAIAPGAKLVRIVERTASRYLDRNCPVSPIPALVGYAPPSVVAQDNDPKMLLTGEDPVSDMLAGTANS